MLRAFGDQPLAAISVGMNRLSLLFQSPLRIMQAMRYAKAVLTYNLLSSDVLVD